METVEKTRLIEKLAARGQVPERLLGIFVKEPLAGQVKTRLSPPLSQEESARLYRVAMRETVERFVAGGLAVVLFYAGSARYFDAEFPGLPRWPQQGGDLGERLNAALHLLLETGCRAAALIGSDSPDLPLAEVNAAFAALDRNDAVTIPAGDGGYVLVGCRRPCPGLFRAIAWSTETVLDQTRQRASEYGLRYEEVGRWSDVDDIESLQALLRRSPESATARFALESFGHLL